MSVRYIDQVPEGFYNGKKVLMRVDFNVPIDDNGNITDDVRIRRVLKSIHYLLDENATIVIATHMGRPKGKVVAEYSLEPVARRLSRLLKKEVQFLDDCIGEKVEKVISAAAPRQVIMLENLRYYAGETENDSEFAKALVAGIDVYVNNAFATAHRAHASVVGVCGNVPVCLGGFLMREELDYFARALKNPLRPLTAIIGGSKVSSKLHAIKNLLNSVDRIIVGGAMAFTFLRAQGFGLGKSMIELDMVDQAREIFEQAMAQGVRFYLPVDCVAAPRIAPDVETRLVPVQEIPKDWMGLDIGPATATLFNEVIQDSKTIVWNGPMGVFELPIFSRGTLGMVHNVASTYALTIVGGGDTDVAVHKAGEVDRISYISTGGGAFLELMEGKVLPAVKALENCSNGSLGDY
ncbi:MAG: phosphoglycerate kinase [Deltaproteobacteria bacterium]|nr:phosphoglycerate kinase [Candidatus Tharpella aukensis]